MDAESNAIYQLALFVENEKSKLNADILGGNSPDLIELGKTPVDVYIRKGLLEDLNIF